MIMRTITFIILLLCCLSCNHEEQARQFQADMERIALQAEPGEIEAGKMGGAKVPEGFPQDVYIYEGATIENAMKMDFAHQKDSYSVRLETQDSLKQVEEKYKTELQKGGWKKSRELNLNVGKKIDYTKGYNYLDVLISKKGNKTLINLQLMVNE